MIGLETEDSGREIGKKGILLNLSSEAISTASTLTVGHAPVATAIVIKEQKWRDKYQSRREQ